jgi:hypothetical protein
MRTFYTASDIEDLVASGTRQLEIGPGVILTGVAKQRAEELGLTLLIPGKAPVSKAVAPVQGGAAPSAALPVRPRGCQHGPLAAATGARREAAPAAPRAAVAGGGGPMVEQLVEAVSALKKRGG